jgi:hypothetical protein
MHFFSFSFFGSPIIASLFLILWILNEIGAKIRP